MITRLLRRNQDARVLEFPLYIGLLLGLSLPKGYANSLLLECVQRFFARQSKIISQMQSSKRSLQKSSLNVGANRYARKRSQFGRSNCQHFVNIQNFLLWLRSRTAILAD